MKNLSKKLLWSLVVVVSAVVILAKYNHIDLTKFFNETIVTEVTEPCSSYPVCVHIIDVGCADSIFIKCEDKNILIDAADNDVSDVVPSYLKRHNVKTLDLVVATHPHRDHIGQMAQVVNTFNIARFIMPHLKDGVMATTKTYEGLLHALDMKKITPEDPIPGTSFQVGNVTVNILAPNAQYDNINNYSVVVKLTYGKSSFLFTGDAEKESEKDMINAGFDLTADILKVGHHGSKTSTTQEFLNAVKPKYAIVSVGPSQHNLPKKDTLNRLTKNGINVLRTDLNGTVIVATDGDKIEISKEKE